VAGKILFPGKAAKAIEHKGENGSLKCDKAGLTGIKGIEGIRREQTAIPEVMFLTGFSGFYFYFCESGKGGLSQGRRDRREKAIIFLTISQIWNLSG
jgi:hypothetical protein